MKIGADLGGAEGAAAPLFSLYFRKKQIDQPSLERNFSVGFFWGKGLALCRNFVGPLDLNFLDPPLEDTTTTKDFEKV